MFLSSQGSHGLTLRAKRSDDPMIKCVQNWVIPEVKKVRFTDVNTDRFKKLEPKEILKSFVALQKSYIWTYSSARMSSLS